jgi:hypothetical protein
VLFGASLVTPFLAAAGLAGGIALARTGVLGRRLGAWLVALCVPALWPGLVMVVSAGLMTPSYWIALLLPDLVLLGLVGASAGAVYWLATRRMPSP